MYWSKYFLPGKLSIYFKQQICRGWSGHALAPTDASLKAEAAPAAQQEYSFALPTI
jgi:hypothetical protein